MLSRSVLLAAPPYRQVTTRTGLPNTIFAGNLNVNTRRYYFARDNIASLRIALPNFAVTGSTGVEAGPGSTTSATALVEWPAGVYTNFKFQGAAAGIIPNNSLIWSDPLQVNIPNGSKLFISTNQVNTAGIAFATGDGTTAIPSDLTNGDAFNVSGGSLTGGAITDTGAGNAGPDPVAIIARSNKRSFALIGDSRSFGYRDAYTDTSGNIGETARSIGPNFAYMNLSVTGIFTSGWLTPANTVNRRALLPYATDKIIVIGINDNNAAVADATIVSNLQAIASLSATRNYCGTVSPYTTSANGWIAPQDQVQASNAGATNPDGLNTLLRAVPAGFVRCLDIASITESGSTAKWVVSPSPPYTTDGLHATSAGTALIQSSGVVNP